jgi:predicted RNase H-like HicB family nuclease
MKYSITIQWSEEDNCFVVFLPEFEDVMQPVTHGDTYEEAFKNAQEVLELLIESALNNNEALPKPNIFGQLLQTA